MNKIEVYIWDILAGTIEWDKDSQLGLFEYDHNFGDANLNPAPIVMPFSQNRNTYVFPGNKPKSKNETNSFRGLPGMLADSLPDRFGSAIFNAWLFSQNRSYESVTPVEFLTLLGRRGMGALEFKSPGKEETGEAEKIDLASIVAVAKKIPVDEAFSGISLTGNEEKALNDLYYIGTSAGGARPKIIVTYNQTTGEVRSGNGVAPEGFEHWLIKLDGVSSQQFGVAEGYCLMEMAYHLMALDCGVEMMPCRLIEENGRKHFMTKRFDRYGADGKYHIQTFCALRHFDHHNVTDYSYEQLFETMRMLNLKESEYEQMFRRMVFNILARNCDAHSKNFSFRMKRDGNWELTPAYDMCFAYKPGHRWISRHPLSVNGKRDDISRLDLLAAGVKAGCGNAEFIVNEVLGVVNRWESYADSAGVPVELKNSIDSMLIKEI